MRGNEGRRALVNCVNSPTGLPGAKAKLPFVVARVQTSAGGLTWFHYASGSLPGTG